ncbi:activating signal cointegrator 1 complex subunit, partial [Quaeritorhiza haematococci]
LIAYYSPSSECVNDLVDDEIQNALVDLLGYNNFEFLTSLLSKRQEIVETVKAEARQRGVDTGAAVSSLSQVDRQPGPGATGTPSGAVVQRPQYGAQVTVMSAEEKLQAKQMRKEFKKKKQQQSLESSTPQSISASLLGFDGELLRQRREEQLRSASAAPLISDPTRPSTEPEEQFPNIFSAGAARSSLSIFGTRFALPTGTERHDYKQYEEIVIPFPKPLPPHPNERKDRVAISGMDAYARRAFKGYQTLNRVQSIVHHVAYETNENMLVCAPTGAGKTDIAMLTILRCLSQHRTETESGPARLARKDFKIVYVAPMKALAAEVVRKFANRLKDVEDDGTGVIVKELTGDMQLTKAEIAATQIIVTTPEKWDVVTRKSVGDTELAQKVRLIIIDEVHLLHEDRGAVIESIVARTCRQVESRQLGIRLIGLSATLPNYVDVAYFLRVNPRIGLFYFDASFRPVPLRQHFIGIKTGRPTTTTTSTTVPTSSSTISTLATPPPTTSSAPPSVQTKNNMNRACFEKVLELVEEGHQVMVFVHARKETVNTAMYLRDEATSEGALGLFECTSNSQHGIAVKEMSKSRNKELKELFGSGFGIHHAGMLRSDRSMVERFFEKGLIKVLCCTATLAWGVNLPAYAVVIKGTQIYDAQKGSFVDLSILDVLQIFGRAGRPQYEDHGVGYIITTHDKLTHYVSAITQQHPIESRFTSFLTDNLNAEVALGTVTNLDEAVAWLSYTYLFVRMRKNPFQYGLDWQELQDDRTLGKRRRELCVAAAKALHKAQMIVFDENTGYLHPKDLGRTASHFYIRTQTIEVYNEMMRPRMTEADVLSMVSLSTEFENIKVNEEEMTELKGLEEDACACVVRGGKETNYGKTNILLQSYISRASINNFALIADTSYVATNAARLLRALFEISLSRNWGPCASMVLSLCKSVDRRRWSFEHPLGQFDQFLPYEIIQKVENASKQLSMEDLRDMDFGEIGEVIKHRKMAPMVMKCVEWFPSLLLEATVAPITRTVLRVTLYITPDFVWNDRLHGSVEPWHIWAEDGENTEILYSEYFLLNKKEHQELSESDTNPYHKLDFTIPIPRTSSTVDELPPQIYIRAVSDRWIGAETVIPVSFKHLILPGMYQSATHTDLLDLQPLPVSALQDPILEEICRKRFDYFNPVQTQIFHTLYWTDHNVLLGAPTGSGKTVAAELAMWAAFREQPKSKVVYIAPLKALVRERVNDWRTRVASYMGRTLVELTGDITPDIQSLQKADIIITTPEKWDGISRSWQSRSYVTSVSLVIIDEIHLLGGDRGPILEVIVSRMNYISSQTNKKVRIVGLSTALANAGDLADWLGIQHVGLFNFRHSVRPVPLEIYIDGFAGKHYCPRMMTMNKPTYSAIMTHSPAKPVIVFVSSRRQTRLTAQDLITLCSLDENPKRFLHMPEEDMELVASQIKDRALQDSLRFGIGLHHAGLVESDRKNVEELFVNNKIQILIATSTLAWGVNYPAHLVVVKGTEYYDAKKKGYVDYPITDVLQMMGRAGRPQFDDSGVARVFVQDTKKNFYKKFLHEPFPVESSLHTCLHDHLNAEIVGGTIVSKQDAIDYLTWTYFFRRLQMNPTYYGAEGASQEDINLFLSKLIEETVSDLADASCIEIEGDFYIEPTTIGRIASFYYLHYTTVGMLKQRLTGNYRFKGNVDDGEPEYGDFAKLARILCDVPEYEELPVRHNEDLLNKELEKKLPVPAMEPYRRSGSTFGGPPRFQGYDSPHLKAFLLLQAHLDRMTSLPCSDYSTDTISVLDQSIRIMQAMVDISADSGFLATSLGIMNLMQCIKQALWPTDCDLLSLPFMTPELLPSLKHHGKSVDSIRELARLPDEDIAGVFRRLPRFGPGDVQKVVQVVKNMPIMDLVWDIPGTDSKSEDGTTAVTLECGKEYTLQVKARRMRRYSQQGRYNRGGGGSPGNNSFQAYSPRYPKPQYENWWMVLGEPLQDELHVLKRVQSQAGGGGAKTQDVAGSITTTVEFLAPDEPGKYTYILNLVSDVYLGLDVEARILINAV